MFDLKPLLPILRVVQHNKRRYALRLEPIFWQGLEKIAAQESMTLGKLVASLAEQDHGVNLSSYLRMVVTHKFYEAATQQQLALAAESTHIWQIVAHCPSPACLIAADRRIILINNALQQWLGTDTAIRGALFDDIFIPRLTRSLSETLALMSRGKLLKTQFQVTYNNQPNQPRAAIATLQAIKQDAHVFGLVWLQSTAPMHVRYV